LCGYKAQRVLGFAGFGEIVFQRRPLDYFSNKTRAKSKHMALQVVARSVSVRKSASLEMWKKSFIGGAGSRQLSGVRLSVCPIRQPHAAAASLLLWAQRPDVDRLLHGGPAVSSSRAAARRAAANAGSATLSANVGS